MGTSFPWPAVIPPCQFEAARNVYMVKCGPYAWLSAYNGIPGAMEVDTQSRVHVFYHQLRPLTQRGSACWLQRFHLPADLTCGELRKSILLELRDACHGCVKG